jgi:hypothetical protein
MKSTTRFRQLAFSLCLFTALWFALGGTLKLWVAPAQALKKSLCLFKANPMPGMK